MGIESVPAWPGINLSNEKPLHAALKAWYAEPGDRCEVPLGGSIIDLVRGELLIEIQTGSVGSLRRKLTRLLQHHPVRLVIPVTREKWQVKLHEDAAPASPTRRKSPRRGQWADVFRELVGVAPLLAHPAFCVEVLLIQEEEVLQPGPARCWRRKGWQRRERRLVGVLERRAWQGLADWAGWLPPGLPEPFTTADLAEHAPMARWLAQKMAYCLRVAGAIEPVGRTARGIGYRRLAIPVPINLDGTVRSIPG